MLFLVGVVAAQRFYQPTLVYPNAPSVAQPVFQAARVPMLFLVGVVAAQRFYQPTLVYPNAPSVAQPVFQAAPQIAMPMPEVQPRVATLGVAGSYTTPALICAAVVGLYVAKEGLAARHAATVDYDEEIITVPALAVSGRAGSIQMNTQYEKSIFDNIGRKKSPKTGDSG